ncbi:MAG: preprotein translocase subunit Sec61beta [Candidatus Pacearchaeota archaeon]
MAEEKVMLPPSFGGLTRYFEEYKSRIEIKPTLLILIIIIFIILELLLNIFG